jgi:hypothetical protein
MDPLVIAVLAAVLWGGVMAALGWRALRRAKARASARHAAQLLGAAKVHPMTLSGGDILIQRALGGESGISFLAGSALVTGSTIEVTALNLGSLSGEQLALFADVILYTAGASNLVNLPEVPQPASAGRAVTLPARAARA